ncbi:hypothetical protein EHQ68_18480 [Leptospira congkakensis]|uniref:Uncharacterized protein n=1 Tax=Leptospira congkakensis TaxID=2484932 RepID=A0A4Z1AA76_9LEPT|nr:hypothetical protein [Leptospira congkakensis]TGL84835.1 hypothetical protein EHQ68_18480 [Leptospira congkakensis]TGL92079.1 hypothetical protein EHQ69_08885 [Leptospira congkakensis]TGL96637.1 hypothetical protein EHQ70_08880 [Leptospira congkakensis]
MNFFRIVFSFLIYIFLGLTNLLAGSNVVRWQSCFQTNCISFDLPSKWYLSERRSNGTSTKFDHFKTSPLKDELGREITPAVVILFKESETKYPLHPTIFHTESKRFSAITNVRKSYSLQKKSNSENTYQFVGVFGSFKDKEDIVLQHYITTTEDRFGMTILVTCYESVYPQIEKDLNLFLDSMSFGKRTIPWSFQNPEEQIFKAKELETSALARLKTKKSEEIEIALDELSDSCDLGSVSACEMFTTLLNLGR